VHAQAPGDKRRIALRAVIGLAAPLLVAGALGILAPVNIYLWLKAFHLDRRGLSFRLACAR
jgi:hypothetical protein